jgi:hypothetical protein
LPSPKFSPPPEICQNRIFPSSHLRELNHPLQMASDCKYLLSASNHLNPSWLRGTQTTTKWMASRRATHINYHSHWQLWIYPPINPIAKMERLGTFIDSNVLFQTKSAITMSEKETFEFNAQRNTNFHWYNSAYFNYNWQNNQFSWAHPRTKPIQTEN